MVTWRARGRRGLLLLLRDGVFLAEAGPPGEGELRVARVPKLRFPRPEDPGQRQHRTLLDVLLVEDREGGRTVPRLLVLDALVFEGGTLMRKPLSHRLKFVFDGVVGARKRDEATDASRYAGETLKVRMKEHFDLHKTEHVLKKVLPNLTHEAEGLVFTPKDSPYEPKGTSILAAAGKGPDLVKRLFAWTPDSDVKKEDLIARVNALTKRTK
mmetsp:Transcript_36794/g.85944  ORF Transcript_36794/g.85944 Transcript_36794/m.85944 type:complete len:212 (-) Transcript_36794:142-777(-)